METVREGWQEPLHGDSERARAQGDLREEGVDPWQLYVSATGCVLAPPAVQNPFKVGSRNQYSHLVAISGSISLEA